ncbi:MAG: hypothetical protein AAGD07_20685 [Planctomycetota bacterium]
MSPVPKRLLIGGFVAGYAVLCGVNGLRDGLDVSAAMVGFVWYTAIVGGMLLIPWALLPVIANQSHRRRRIFVAILAGLIPSAFAVAATTYLFTVGDAPQSVRLAICLSMAVSFLSAFAALAYTVARGTSRFSYERMRAYPVIAAITCVAATLMVATLTSPIIAMGGWVTRTESPDVNQVAHAREFLLINSTLEIEPLAYYLKDGMDYMVRFKFLAKTGEPMEIFDRSYVSVSTFQTNFSFPPGEETHNESWWDVSSRPMSGGYVRVPHDRTMTVGYVENDDRTITVYAWRHEGSFEHISLAAPTAPE